VSFAKKDKDKAPNVVAEVLGKFATYGEANCDACRSAPGSMGEAAARVIQGAMQEGNGLGFVPAAVRQALAGALPGRSRPQIAANGYGAGAYGTGGYGAGYDRNVLGGILFDVFGGEPQPARVRRRPEPTPDPASRGDRRAGNAMPFARDFGKAAADAAFEARRRAAAGAQARRTTADAQARARATGGAFGGFGETSGGWDAPPPSTAAPQADPAISGAYATLGLTVGTPFAEVKRRYYDLARKYHGDLHGTADDRARRAREEKMKEINVAAEILRDHLDS